MLANLFIKTSSLQQIDGVGRLSLDYSFRPYTGQATYEHPDGGSRLDNQLVGFLDA
jgi:hypothetical protein